MKWFAHQTDAANNKKLRRLEVHYKPQGGQAVMAAVGRFWRLYEIVGQQGMDEKGLDTFRLPADYDLAVLADDLYCTLEELEELLEVLAEANSIDTEAWKQERQVYCPKLSERADRYSKRLQNKKAMVYTECAHNVPECAHNVPECAHNVPECAHNVPECADQQIQVQVQRQEQEEKNVRTDGQVPTSIFTGLGFDVDAKFLEKLASDYPALSEAEIRLELSKFSDYVSDHPGKYAVDRRGRLKNTKNAIRNWLEMHLKKRRAREPTVLEPKGFAGLRDYAQGVRNAG